MFRCSTLTYAVQYLYNVNVWLLSKAIVMLQCYNKSAHVPASVEQFIKDRPIMDEAVSHSNMKAGHPLYLLSEVIFNSIAVDTVSFGGKKYIVFYLGTGIIATYSVNIMCFLNSL